MARGGEESEEGAVELARLDPFVGRHREGLDRDRALVLEAGEADVVGAHSEVLREEVADLQAGAIDLLDGEVEVRSLATRRVERNLFDLEVLTTGAEHTADRIEIFVEPRDLRGIGMIELQRKRLDPLGEGVGIDLGGRIGRGR